MGDPRSSTLTVVLFSGGRGSQVLSEQLIADPHVSLVIAINGYDDGLSTGEVRRLLGDALGPSDFRKNASRLARALGTAPPALLEIVDLRLPGDCSLQDGRATLLALHGEPPREGPGRKLAEQVATLPGPAAAALAEGARWLLAELEAKGERFDFRDCAVGNLVFAGCFLREGRRFNAALDAYCALLGLRPGVVDNVSDGTNAFLAAVGRDGRLFATEAEIVDASRHRQVAEIFLLARPPSPEECDALAVATPAQVRGWLEAREVEIPPNPRVLERLAEADLVIYAPGTQHSSLFPSYLTHGLGEAIAGNLRAIKLLVTNLHEDTEIADLSAVELVERAVHYLRLKGRCETPTPCLVTHYLINDPAGAESRVPHVPLGVVETFEDPRLVRIANFEHGATGTHDARKVIGPFVESLLRRPRLRVAVLLLQAESVDKLAQTILEALRGGLAEADAEVDFFHASPRSLPDAFCDRLPVRVENVWREGEPASARLLRAACEERFDYALLFESSGMYRGAEIVNLLSVLRTSRLDAAWGSRRLSVSGIQESYRLRYRKHRVLGALSYVGSHLLSLAYLLFYGRYLADTLSGVRAVRPRHLALPGIDLESKLLNHRLLSAVLAERGEIFETPVQFFSMAPDRVTRTTVLDGLAALAWIAWGRLRPAAGARRPAAIEP